MLDKKNCTTPKLFLRRTTDAPKISPVHQTRIAGIIPYIWYIYGKLVKRMFRQFPPSGPTEFPRWPALHRPGPSPWKARCARCRTMSASIRNRSRASAPHPHRILPGNLWALRVAEPRLGKLLVGGEAEATICKVKCNSMVAMQDYCHRIYQKGKAERMREIQFASIR